MGGVVGAALIAAALFYFLWRSRTGHSTAPLMVQNTGYPASDGTSATPRPAGYWGQGPSPNVPTTAVYELSFCFLLSPFFWDFCFCLCHLDVLTISYLSCWLCLVII